MRAGPHLYWGKSGPQLTPAGCDQGCRRVAARRCPAVVVGNLTARPSDRFMPRSG